MVKLTIPAIPIAQPRHRAVIRGKHAGSAPPPKSHPIHDFKASVRREFKAAYQGPPFEGPIAIIIVFIMPRPKNMLWKSKPMPREPYIVCKNDWDNLGKGVCDALNGLAWRDDGQIWSAHVERWIASGSEPPHVEMTIYNSMMEKL